MSACDRHKLTFYILFVHMRKGRRIVQRVIGNGAKVLPQAEVGAIVKLEAAGRSFIPSERKLPAGEVSNSIEPPPVAG